MQHLSAVFLIIALAIVDERVVNAQNVTIVDQVADETNTVVALNVTQETYTTEVQPIVTTANLTNITINITDIRPPSKPVQKPPDKRLIPDRNVFVDVKHHFYIPKQLQPKQINVYNKDLKYSKSLYKYPGVIPAQRGNLFYNRPNLQPRQPIMFAASSNTPRLAGPNPKFSIPVQTINGIRTDFVKPPKQNVTTTSTPPTTTTKILRTKRIWPKRILDKLNSTSTSSNATFSSEKLTNNNDDKNDLTSVASRVRLRYVTTERPSSTTTVQPTTRVYRRVTRTSKIQSTTPLSFQSLPSNDWVPIVPSHYAKLRRPSQTPISKRSDSYFETEQYPANQKQASNLQYGLIPMNHQLEAAASSLTNHRIILFRKKKPQVTRYYHPKIPKLHRQISQPQLSYDDLQKDQNQIEPQKVITQVKHHHHHHHHRYVKTVEKPVKVPYEVEVPKPYPVEKKVPVPVPVERVKVVDRPYPVTVEKKVPYPVHVKVPYKVVEKEYVPRPYPVVHHVPVVKHVQVKVPHPVPVQVEKKVPYPVQVPYTVEKQIPVPVQIEKRIPYPVPYKVFVPQPITVEKKIPYPVEIKVKEPYEVIKHVHVKVPILQPYPVKVPQPIPITIEKRVPFPIKVEKKIPVPVEVLVPQKVEVEKRVPIYVPKPYPVEKKVPYPVKIPYPVQVPVKVPVQIPIEVPVYIHRPFQMNGHGMEGVEQNIYGDASDRPYYGEDEDISRSASEVSSTPSTHTVTVHGNTGYNGFKSRSDTVTTPASTTNV
ncbi:putative cuticle protein CPH41 [Danaus plexippus plexippus]|uniref:Cuticle protein CPH41 n=1 Tax=Danaus plexippus plexippus TaxID=278856 RepID=A0A212FC78_DANPL|nr:putative cuticle protein CPH41 [Danaus plexippus plexippus]